MNTNFIKHPEKIFSIKTNPENYPKIFNYSLFNYKYSPSKIVKFAKYFCTILSAAIQLKCRLTSHTASTSHKLFHPFYSIAILAIFYSSAGFATCTVNNVVVTFPDLNFNMHNVPLDGKIGGEQITSPQTIATCNNGGARPRIKSRYIADAGIGGYTINGHTIYPTSAPGIGYAVALEPVNFCTPGQILWAPFKTCEDFSSGSDNINEVYKAKLHFQLHKIGPLGNANNISVYNNFFGVNEINAWDQRNQVSRLYMTANPFNIALFTCSLQTASLTDIALPKINSSDLPSIGSLTASQPFYITINCPNPTTLGITFTDNNSIGQTSNILTPSSTSTATGVGVQLQYNNNAISFGPDSAEPGTTNQIVLNSNLTGTQSFPFSASYIRTGPITPGSLSATSTFTLSYQ